MKKYILIIAYLFIPLLFSHALEITEIMYNPEGADTNREWVEIYNDESQSVDITIWHFFENDTHHGLYPDGFQNLDSGEYALIVKDVASARSELGSGIKYIKASFSLNNTGEPIALSDADKNIIDQVHYQSDQGANGDGQSLQKIQGSWRASSSTPGRENRLSSGSTNGSGADDSSSEEVQEKKEEKPAFQPYYRAFIEIPEVIVAQNNFPFVASVQHVEEEGTVREIDGYYFVNFGNGDSLESRKMIDTHYRYRRPGRYVVSFEYYTSRLAFENGDEPDAFLRKDIVVTVHDIHIADVNSFDGVVLKNNTQKMVNFDGWKIVWGGKTYSFPRHSYLHPKDSVSLLFQTLGFYPRATRKQPLILLSNDYKPVAIFPPVIKKKKKTSPRKTTSHRKKKTSQKKSESKENYLSFEQLPDSTYGFFGEKGGPYLDEYLEEHPDKLRVQFEESESETEQGREEKNQNSSMFYILGSFLLMLGAGRFIKHRNTQEKIDAQKEDYGSIEIIE